MSAPLPSLADFLLREGAQGQRQGQQQQQQQQQPVQHSPRHVIRLREFSPAGLQVYRDVRQRKLSSSEISVIIHNGMSQEDYAILLDNLRQKKMAKAKGYTVIDPNDAPTPRQRPPMPSSSSSSSASASSPALVPASSPVPGGMGVLETDLSDAMGLLAPGASKDEFGYGEVRHGPTAILTVDAVREQVEEQELRIRQNLLDRGQPEHKARSRLQRSFDASGERAMIYGLRVAHSTHRMSMTDGAARLLRDVIRQQVEPRLFQEAQYVCRTRTRDGSFPAHVDPVGHALHQQRVEAAEKIRQNIREQRETYIKHLAAHELMTFPEQQTAKTAKTGKLTKKRKLEIEEEKSGLDMYGLACYGQAPSDMSELLSENAELDRQEDEATERLRKKPHPVLYLPQDLIKEDVIIACQRFSSQRKAGPRVLRKFEGRLGLLKRA